MNSNAIDIPSRPAMESYYPSIGQAAGEERAMFIPKWSMVLLRRVECKGFDHRRAHDHCRAKVTGYMSQDL